MRFTNESGLPGGWTLGFERDGRERLVIAVKATYRLPADGAEALPHDEPVPLVTADLHTGEPGLSAPLHETDYAHAKPGCDVLLVGSAWAPGGRPAPRVPVRLCVGAMDKAFTVTGARRWRHLWVGLAAGDPEPMLSQPISYDVAFGGTQQDPASPAGSRMFDPNPVGRGFTTDSRTLDGQWMPVTEELDRPVTGARDDWRPMAFGPIGRHWVPRRQWAGTYDEAWSRTRAPFWPDDFDERYFQAAPPDQVIAHPEGGEQVMLRHLTPDGLRRFQLPRRTMPVLFIPYRGRDLLQHARLDTIVLEPDALRFTLTWRATLALAGSVFDVQEVVVGERPAAWHRARRFPGKTYYPGLRELVAARRRTGRL
jgi:hypothetical protein